MKTYVQTIIRIAIITGVFCFIEYSAYSQGNILVRIDGLYSSRGNSVSRTRIGSINGELAGENILGQMLVGINNDALSPVGAPIPHLIVDQQNSGFIYIRNEIPIEIASQDFFGQLAVWDGSHWGTDIDNVPKSQIGYSDVARAPAYNGIGPIPTVIWEESAIVPNIPEASTIMLVLIGWGLIMIFKDRSS